MYLIGFEIDNDIAKECDIDINALLIDIRVFMLNRGFSLKYTTLYVGNKDINSVDCVLVMQDLAKRIPNFSLVAKDINMMRVSECCDLAPAIQKNN